MYRNIVLLLVVADCGRWLHVDQAVGESVRAQQPRRSDHEFQPRSGRVELSRARVRIAHRCAWRRRRSRGRLWLQLSAPAAWRALRCCAAAVLRERRDPSGGSRGRDVSRLRRRRPRGERPVGARAQRLQRQGVRVGQLLRRHDQQRVDRRRCDGEPVRGDAQRIQRRHRLSVRQDDDGVRLHQKRGGRLSRQHRALRHQPGLLRRSDDAGHFVRARLERRHEERRSRRSRNIRLGRTGASICRRSSRRTW